MTKKWGWFRVAGGQKNQGLAKLSIPPHAGGLIYSDLYPWQITNESQSPKFPTI